MSFVIEFHYDNGDVGAHRIAADADLTEAADLTTVPSDFSHIVIRRDTVVGQTASSVLHAAPDLLQLAKQRLEDIIAKSLDSGDDPTAIDWQYDDLRTAITKAEGE